MCGVSSHSHYYYGRLYGGVWMNAYDINTEIYVTLIIMFILLLIALWITGWFDPYLLGGS
jgi:hypothetical protein